MKLAKTPGVGNLKIQMVFNDTRMQSTLEIFILANQHEDGIHKTILSLIEATRNIEGGASLKLVLGNDISTSNLRSYLDDNSSFLESASITVVGQLQPSKASKFTAIIEAGGCITEQTLLRLISAATANDRSIVYPDTSVEYLDVLKPNKVYKNVVFPQDATTALLSAWHDQRLSRFILFPTDALKQYTPPHKMPGYGHTNWHLVSSLINENHLPLRITETAIFSLGRSTHSSHKELLSPSSLYSLVALRGLTIDSFVNEVDTISTKDRVKNLLDNYPLLTKVAQKSLHYASVLKKATRPSAVTNGLDKHTDAWLIKEANTLHQLNASIFLSPQKKFHIHKYVDSLDEGLRVGTALAQSAQQLRHNTYDYVLFVPWLIAGGADMFFINYANAIANLRPDKKVLIISTEPSRQSLSNKELNLSDRVDFLRLAEIVGKHKNSETIISQSLALIIDIVQASVIHVGLSRLGYRYVARHNIAIKESNRKIVLTGYNEIVTNDGKREGYVHDIIPSIFKYADVIVTDNDRIATLWQTEYGLAPSKVMVHHQPFIVPHVTRKDIQQFDATTPVRVLWAAHIRKEKNPNTFADVAKQLADDPTFTFTAYGALDKAHFRKNPFTHPGSPNLQYSGSYRKFFEEVKPDNYDVFIYTSLADGTPNILIEAGLSELPIVTSNVGGIESLIGKNGHLVNNPTDTDDFVKNLIQFRDNPSDGYKKAARFKKHLLAMQTYDAFNAEITDMLKKLGY